ncbi:hypothetical protein H9P43_007221 [Blastocladiella emersonii ATCC 22665]|nr:hypothetical protein H9P43_007221 [Blastocladiella emersonii ATCC 22665]
MSADPASTTAASASASAAATATSGMQTAVVPLFPPQVHGLTQSGFLLASSSSSPLLPSPFAGANPFGPTAAPVTIGPSSFAPAPGMVPVNPLMPAYAAAAAYSSYLNYYNTTTTVAAAAVTAAAPLVAPAAAPSGPMASVGTRRAPVKRTASEAAVDVASSENDDDDDEEGDEEESDDSSSSSSRMKTRSSGRAPAAKRKRAPLRSKRKTFSAYDKAWLENKFCDFNHPTNAQIKAWCEELGDILEYQVGCFCFLFPTFLATLKSDMSSWFTRRRALKTPGERVPLPPRDPVAASLPPPLKIMNKETVAPAPAPAPAPTPAPTPVAPAPAPAPAAAAPTPAPVSVARAPAAQPPAATQQTKDHLTARTDPSTGGFAGVEAISAKDFTEWLYAEKGDRSKPEKLKFLAMLRRSRPDVLHNWIGQQSAPMLLGNWMVRCLRERDAAFARDFLSTLAVLPITAAHLPKMPPNVIKGLRRLPKEYADHPDVAAAADNLMAKWSAMAAQYVPSAGGSSAGSGASSTSASTPSSSANGSPAMTNGNATTNGRRPLLRKERITKPTTPNPSPTNILSQLVETTSISAARPAAPVAAARPAAPFVPAAKPAAAVASAAPSPVDTAAPAADSDRASGVASPTSAGSDASTTTATPVVATATTSGITRRTAAPRARSTGILRRPELRRESRGNIRWRDEAGRGELCAVKEFTVEVDPEAEMHHPHAAGAAGRSARDFDKLEGRVAFAREKLDPSIDWRAPVPWPVAAMERGTFALDRRSAPPVAINYTSEAEVPPSPSMPRECAPGVFESVPGYEARRRATIPDGNLPSANIKDATLKAFVRSFEAPPPAVTALPAAAAAGVLGAFGQANPQTTAQLLNLLAVNPGLFNTLAAATLQQQQQQQQQQPQVAQAQQQPQLVPPPAPAADPFGLSQLASNSNPQQLAQLMSTLGAAGFQAAAAANAPAPPAAAPPSIAPPANHGFHPYDRTDAPAVAAAAEFGGRGGRGGRGRGGFRGGRGAAARGGTRGGF